MFELINGIPHFRGLSVVHRSVEIEGARFEVDALLDAADLLDLPDVGRRFLEEDLAPYGLELWPSAVMLARHLLADEPGAGRTAIELGAGLGLSSFAAAKAGWRVVLTDNEPMALQFAAHNATLNHLDLAGIEPLDWRSPPPGRQYDRVLAADVLYQLVDHQPLLTCIEALLAPCGTALVADPNRGVADRFESLAKERGFVVEVLQSAAPDHAGRRVAGRIHVMRRRAQGGGVPLSARGA